MNLDVGFRSRRVRERLIKLLQKKGITHPEVLDAIRTIPRHEFVERHAPRIVVIDFRPDIRKFFIAHRLSHII